ncbi:hypothetical protein VPNG_07579 [Cytospora leucostoma]|uniref:Uncharacterized protein n=1 Tax=Cytospora leucostoma TaxID=1230097 RepID=A0A423WDB9_9PEZI|nr:hypothetical protein VPNG_07579 [Cytospora leucostoma]
MKPTSRLLAIFAAISPSLAAPLSLEALHDRVDFDPPPGGDVTILNYALTLEYLERKFWQDGLAKFNDESFLKAGFWKGFYEELQEIYADEQDHVSFFSDFLGDAAIKEPTFSFPYSSARDFVSLASVLEGVGVSAYLGAAGAIADKTYLGAASSILTVEARHSSFLREALHTPIAGKPYDTPLDFKAVYSLAAQFITGVPGGGGPALPFSAFPPLTAVPLNGTGPVIAGSSGLLFKGAHKNALEVFRTHSIAVPVYATFYSGLDAYYIPVEVSGDDYKVDKIPGADYATPGQLGPVGQVYVVLSTANGTGRAGDENVISGVAIVEVVAGSEE